MKIFAICFPAEDNPPKPHGALPWSPSYNMGTAPLGGGPFGQRSHSLDSPGDSASPSFSTKLSLLPISNSEVSDGTSCLRVPVRALPLVLSGPALASGRVPSSACL